MKIIKVEQGSDEWQSFREGKFSGTKIGKLYAKSRKKDEMFDTEKANLQFYQILAERLAVATADGLDDRSAMERGKLLESEAIKVASDKLKLSNVATDNVWQDETNPDFICSPDAYEDTDQPTWAIEIKCLTSANHIKAIYEDKRPNDYDYQCLNYFAVNPNLKTLYFCMYDPRFFSEELQLKTFIIERSEVIEDIEQLKQARDIAQKQINDFVERYSF